MSLIRPLSQSRDRITADFFVGSYRFSGSVVAHRYSMIKILNDKATDHLTLVDIYISPFNKPGEIVSTQKRGLLIKDKIDFILLPPETSQDLKEKTQRANEVALPVYITLPSYEIGGKLQMHGSTNAKALLTGDTRKFLPILDAMARNAFLPDIKYQSPVLLVNKTRIQFWSLGDGG